MNMLRTLLVTGGARSGKSGFAQSLAEDSSLRKVLIATAEAGDHEMAARIDRHRRDRQTDWHVVEEPRDICDKLMMETAPDCIVVVDCLTLWLANQMFAGRDVETEIDALSRCVLQVSNLGHPLILVTNEVGSGIVPVDALTRAFRDHQGRLNQSVAKVCAQVVLVVAGCPLQIKPQGAASVRF
jgi:adenosylcobinamide kinase/adenosylcobinamide-phosphate guanylyltransferase